MFEPFVPLSAQRIRDRSAISLLRHLHRRAVVVPDLVTADRSTTVPTAVVMPDLADTPDLTPLVLLHGFDSSLLEFRYLLPYFASKWPTYGLDLLGFGFTAHLPAVPIEPRTIRQHLYHTWKLLLDRPVTLLGASLGGAVAIDFALTYPDCVERLILVDSVGLSGGFALGKFLSPSLLDWGTRWLRFRKEAACQALEFLPLADPALRDTMLCSALHQEMPGWQRSVMSFTQSGGYGDLANRIPQIRQPTLILWGDSDQVLGTQDARQFERAIPRSRLVWVKNADHTPHICAPQVVAREILREIDFSETLS